MIGNELEDGPQAGDSTCVVAIVGYSDIGKTTLLERLIPRLCSRGLAVGAVKHTSHGFDADRPGKDSHRIYRAGASAVTLASEHQLATFRRREKGGVRLGEALAELPESLDLVLVEGFAWESVPRFVLVRAGEASPAEHVKTGPVLAIVEVAEPKLEGPPNFESDVLEALVEQLVDRVSAMRTGRSPTRIAVRKPWLPIPIELAEEGI